jgi:hypothetical protein
MTNLRKELVANVATEMARAMATNPAVDPITCNPRLFAERAYMLSAELVMVLERNINNNPAYEAH